MWFISSNSKDNIIIMQLDLWELPQPRHTDMITANIERNFYSRCPSDKRPNFMRRLPPDTLLSESEPNKTASSGNAVSKGREKPGNVESNKLEEPTKKAKRHDESLFKALHHTFLNRILVSGFLLLMSGK